jgi:nitroreductase
MPFKRTGRCAGILASMDRTSDNPALAQLLGRHSVAPRHLASPAPTDAELRAAFAAALRGPDHRKLVPFRFAVIRGDGLARLAELFLNYGRRHGESGDVLEHERTRAMQAPLVIAVIARIDPSRDVPAHEQWCAVGGAISNLLNALHFMQYGAKMLSGARAADPEVAAAFCGQGEQLVGWVSVGTPQTPPEPRGADPVDEVFAEF